MLPDPVHRAMFHFVQEAAASDSDEEDDFIYNPLKLPLGWDGKPIPYWLYKLHGLNQEFQCEICGGATYWGRRALSGTSESTGTRPACVSWAFQTPRTSMRSLKLQMHRSSGRIFRWGMAWRHVHICTWYLPIAFVHACMLFGNLQEVDQVRPDSSHI